MLILCRVRPRNPSAHQHEGGEGIEPSLATNRVRVIEFSFVQHHQRTLIPCTSFLPSYYPFLQYSPAKVHATLCVCVRVCVFTCTHYAIR